MGLFGHNVLLLVIIYLHYDSMIATEYPLSELRYDPNIVYVSVYSLTHIARRTHYASAHDGLRSA